MKKIIIGLLITTLLVSLVTFFYKSDIFVLSEKEYIPSEYELKQIEYFNEIALKSEYFDNPERVTKWRKKMSLFVFDETNSEENLKTITNTIEDINSISSDGFQIEITDDYNNSNAFMYLCNKNKLEKIAPKFYDLLNDSINYDYSGFSYVEFKWSNFVITKALIFIDTDYPIEEQKHSIVEELTQSIGLLNDSDKYPESIFYDNDSIKNSKSYQYSKMDIALISFLYNPKMKPGYGAKSAELVIKKILKNRNDVLNR